MSVTIAIQRDGTMLRLNEEVTIKPGLNSHYRGLTFIIIEMTPFGECESGTLCKVQVKGDESKVVKGTTGNGIDANWFKKVENIL